MVDVFEQVEEELRSDRYSRLARKWLPVVGAVLGIALLAALGWWGWDAHQTRQANAASAAYDRGLEMLQAGNPRGADAQFIQAAKGNAAYKSLALAMRAGIAESENRIPQAIEFFDQSAKAARDPLLADAQALKAAWLVMDSAPDQAAKRLEPLAEEGRPLRAAAEEAQALLLLQQGKSKEARDILAQLQLRPDVPQGVRDRAQAAVGLIDAGAAGNLTAIIKGMPVNPPAALPQQPAFGPGPGGPQ